MFIVQILRIFGLSIIISWSLTCLYVYMCTFSTPLQGMLTYICSHCGATGIYALLLKLCLTSTHWHLDREGVGSSDLSSCLVQVILHFGVTKYIREQPVILHPSDITNRRGVEPERPMTVAYSATPLVTRPRPLYHIDSYDMIYQSN